MIKVLPAVLYFFDRLEPMLEYKGVLAAEEHMLAAITEPRFWAIQLWLVILLLIFVASKELIGAIGTD